MDQLIRDHYAWYGKMSFVAHFLKALGMGRSQVGVHFHNVVRLSDFDRRQDCSAHCQEQIANGLARELSSDNPID